MGPLLLCIIVVIAIPSKCWSEEDEGFQPTPIPWNYWGAEDREGRADSQTSAAPVIDDATHYWEDALRHSVYLTLVRDKIDQLIAKGEVISPDSKPEQAKEVDDHDLWDKIKNAPFDRLQQEEGALGDVTMMAKGRLIEEGSNYRFKQDERNAEKCNGTCDEVKAYWSVKRVRQRENDNSGRYHYELTFSVITQPPKQKRKPYENPTRTFTVRESAPETIVDKPHEHHMHPYKAQKSLWVHKNIVTKQRYHSRQYQNGLDRLFSSLFADDDDGYKRVKPKPTYVPQTYSQYSKVGYVNTPSESHQHKKLTPYPYKPHTVKYTRPPLPPPPMHHTPHYLDMDSIGVVSNHYMPQYQDNRYGPPNKPQSVAPSAVEQATTEVNKNDSTTNETVTKSSHIADFSTGIPEIITGYHKNRPPMKVSYYPDHLRPPVYNAPPGVFVTMDKKPFKPMPPLRLHSKPIKTIRPSDFRPSPQLVDVQFSDPVPLSDAAFRPINLKYSDGNATESAVVAESNKPKDNVYNKWNATETVYESKPTKKYENKKAPALFTTMTPDIITAQTSYQEDDDPMHWAGLLTYNSKPTPIGTFKEKPKEVISTTTPMTTSTTTTEKQTTTTTEEVITTLAPKKRTRPPPVFDKQVPKATMKPKKHKRLTTTTTTTQAPEKTSKNIETSYASTASNKPKKWVPTTTTAEPTTKAPEITTSRRPTTSAPKTTSESVIISFTTEKPKTTAKPKNTSRYRLSSLMYKGTSVKHDKWSAVANNVAESNPKPRIVAPPGKVTRRKGSNFQGYGNANKTESEAVTERFEEIHKTATTASTKPTQSTFEDTADQYDAVNQSASESQPDTSDQPSDDDDNYEQDNEETEQSTSEEKNSDGANEIIKSDNNEPESMSIDQTVVESSVSASKNKTKCKKKKNSTSTAEGMTDAELDSEPVVTTMVPTTTEAESLTTKDIFEELFGGFSADDVTETISTDFAVLPPEGELDNEASVKMEKSLKVDDDFEGFLDDLENKGAEPKMDELYDEEKELSDEVPSFDNEEENESESGRGVQSESYDELEERSPYSLFELMAME